MSSKSSSFSYSEQSLSIANPQGLTRRRLLRSTGLVAAAGLAGLANSAKAQLLPPQPGQKTHFLADTASGEGADGLLFALDTSQEEALLQALSQWLHELQVHPSLYRLERLSAARMVRLCLSTPPDVTDTLSFGRQSRYWVYDDEVQLPAKDGGTRGVDTVSLKEVLLSLMQHGRTTVIQAESAQKALEELKEHVALRQHIVAWAQDLSWGWPDGGPAFWNNKFWNRGTPHSKELTLRALQDTLVQAPLYGIGCYTAAKMVYAGAVLDFYARVRKDAHAERRVLEVLWRDEDPLVSMEPGAMWSFEPAHTPEEDARPGKLLRLHKPVAPRNFVPGDWCYFWNTDPVTYQKTGYEGSNAIYLGRNRFSDYYNDNGHGYTYEQKLDDVYQWRYGVFSRRRDYLKVKQLQAADYLALEKSPAEGGLLVPWRSVPLNAAHL